MRNEKKDRDIISDREFNRVLKEKRIPPPWKDSQGDTAFDESIETNLGKNFVEEENEEDVLADTPAEPEDKTNSEENLSNDVGVQSSSRPDPLEDIDSSTSTH